MLGEEDRPEYPVKVFRDRHGALPVSAPFQSGHHTGLAPRVHRHLIDLLRHVLSLRAPQK